MWRGEASLVEKGPATNYFGGCQVLDLRQAFGPMWWGGDPFVIASGIYWTSTFLVKKTMTARYINILQQYKVFLPRIYVLFGFSMFSKTMLGRG